jgi:hypothetical protein
MGDRSHSFFLAIAPDLAVIAPSQRSSFPHPIAIAPLPKQGAIALNQKHDRPFPSHRDCSLQGDRGEVGVLCRKQKLNALTSFGMVRLQEGVEWVIVRLEWNAPYEMAIALQCHFLSKMVFIKGAA